MSFRFRLLGFLPLVFWIAHAWFYREHGGLSHLLWMCNQANLLLCVGLFTAQPFLIRLAVIWLIPGLPLWLGFVVMQGGWLLTLFFGHVGGLLVGLISISKVRFNQQIWLYAVGWYLLAQHLCRLSTPAELNVNLAHRVSDGWENIFSSYLQFWLLTTLLVATGLWFLGFILSKLLAPCRNTMPVG